MMSSSVSKQATQNSAVTMIRMLPPLPDVAQQILRRFNDEFISAAEIAAIVECDPSVSARLFGLANSAYFGLSQPVTDMRQVVSRVLGPDTVRTLAFALAADQTFDLSRCPHFDAREFWQRALSAAACARRISKVVKDMRVDDKEFAYLTGMCHNLGMLALVCLYPQQTDALIVECAADSDLDFDALCVDEFGFTRAEATVELALHWGMPEPVIEAYRAQARQDDEDANQLAIVLDASIAAARFLDSSTDDADRQPDDLPTLAAEALGLEPGVLQKASMGSVRQQEAVQSAVQAMVGG